MSECFPSDSEPAEYVRRLEEEMDAQRRRLEPLDAEELKRILRDPSGPTAARQIAMEQLTLRFRKAVSFDATQIDCLADLVADPNPAIAEMAIKHCPLRDEHLRAQVRALLDSPRDRIRAAAAVALARAGDETILPKLLDWLEGPSEPMRNLAIEGLHALDTPESRSALEAAYREGGRDENDKTVLAIALLRLGDTRGLPFLEAVARRAQGPWSVTAAAWIYDHEPREGLQLLLHILERGDDEAKRCVVNQIWSRSRPRIAHPFTSEGLGESRAWIEAQLRSTQSS
jgi:HEAT repeat protein